MNQKYGDGMSAGGAVFVAEAAMYRMLFWKWQGLALRRAEEIHCLADVETVFNAETAAARAAQ